MPTRTGASERGAGPSFPIFPFPAPITFLFSTRGRVHPEGEAKGMGHLNKFRCVSAVSGFAEIALVNP